jgi:vitamin B12 transporter
MGSVGISAEAPPLLPAPTAGRTEIDAARIEASGATDLAEVVALAPGVAISANGGSGGQTAISIRGSTTNQVLVLVDGVPASDPSTGLVDFSKLGLAPADVEKVTVIRGGASSQYGADAVGGVVLVTTKKAAGVTSPGLELSLSNLTLLPSASVRGYGLSAVQVAPDPAALVDGQEVSARLDLPWGLSATAGFERAANAFSYHDTSGERRTRANADLLGGRAGLSWAGGLGGGRLETALEADARVLGIPGSVTAPTPEARERDLDARASLSWTTDAFFRDNTAFTATAYGLLKQLDYRETAADAGDLNRSTRGGLDARWSILAGEKLSLGLGLSGRYEGLVSTNVTNAAGAGPERFGAGAYIEPSLSLGGWKLVPALRLDWTSDFPSGLSLSLGLARKLGEGLLFSANLSTAYRAPSFDDLYWPAQAGAEGNPNLVPESSLGGDLGLKLEREGYSLSLSGFTRYVGNVILWQPGADGVWRPSNWGRALYPGLEASLEAKLGGLDLGLGASFIHSHALSGSLGLADDRRVPLLPGASFHLRLGRDTERLQASATLDYTGLRYTGIENRDYLPSHLVIDLHLGVKGGSGRSYVLDLANLLNERYETVQGYPMPGFSLKAKIVFRLGEGR